MKFLIDPDEFRQTGQRQRDMAHAVAAKLSQGEQLTESERLYAAALVRMAADAIPLEQTREKAGQSPQYCHTSAIQLYAAKRASGVAKTLALDEVAEFYGVSRPSIGKLVKGRAHDVSVLLETYSGNRVFTPLE